jgi:hypothetical protein
MMDIILLLLLNILHPNHLVQAAVAILIIEVEMLIEVKCIHMITLLAKKILLRKKVTRAITPLILLNIATLTVSQGEVKVI